MDLKDRIEQNKGRALDALKELVRIQREAGNPVQTWAEEEHPFGQGVQDAFAYEFSKDPVDTLAVFFAGKALQEAGCLPAGMQELQEAAREVLPSKDIDKGMLVCEIARKLSRPATKGLTLTRLSGGVSYSMVPRQARAVVKADKAAYEVIRQKAGDFSRDTGHRIRCKGVGKALELLAEGKACHGAVPERGVNAIFVMFAFLGELNFVSEDLNEFIEFYNRYIGVQPEGAGMMDMSGDLPEPVVWNNGQVAYDGESITLNMNIRYPAVCTPEEIYRKMEPILDEYSLGIVKLKEVPPGCYLSLEPEDLLQEDGGAEGRRLCAMMEIYGKLLADRVPEAKEEDHA